MTQQKSHILGHVIIGVMWPGEGYHKFKSLHVPEVVDGYLEFQSTEETGSRPFVNLNMAMIKGYTVRLFDKHGKEIGVDE